MGSCLPSGKASEEMALTGKGLSMWDGVRREPEHCGRQRKRFMQRTELV